MVESLNNSVSEIPNKMLYVSFNQDSSCFSIGTEKGFQIFNSDPFQETFRRSTL